MKIGEFLNIYRKEHGLSMEELANRCGLSKAYISKLEATVSNENAKQIKPSIQTFNKIANGLNISLTDLLSTLDSEQEVTLGTEYDNLSNAINKGFLEEINSYFEFLNDIGKQEAIKRVEELTYIPKYSKSYNSLNNYLKKNSLEEEKGSLSFMKVIPLADVALSAGEGIEPLTDTAESIEVDSREFPKADIAFKVKGDSMEPRYYDGDIVYVKSQPTLDNGQIGAFLYNDEQYLKKYIFENGKHILRSLNNKYKDIVISENDSYHVYGKVLN